MMKDQVALTGVDRIVVRAELAGSRERELIARAQAGGADAFEALLRPRLARLLRIALSIMANEADARDVVQDSCLVVWRELPRLRDADRFDPWLARIVVNRCRSALRGRRRTAIREIPADVLDAESIRVPMAAGPGDDESALGILRRAFGRLDPDKRAIVVLHHIDGRSVLEIADLLHVPEGTVKWRLHSARKALARALEVERR
jgi:RNA polymerase sigma-70 factor, ECF subfamily